MEKKTLRSELIRMVVKISTVTVLALLIILLGVISNNLYQKAKDDMDFYMVYMQEQFEKRLQFLEEISISFKEDQQVCDFFQNQTRDNNKMREQMQLDVNLFSDNNLIHESYPVVRDLYIINDRSEYIGNNFYSLSDTERIAIEKKILQFFDYYQSQNLKFGCQVRGGILDICFPVYDANMNTMGYCIASLDQEYIESIFEPLEKYNTYYWEVLDENDQYVFGKRLKAAEYKEREKETGELTHGTKTYFYQRKEHSFGLAVEIVIPKSALYSDIKQLLLVGGGIFTAVLVAMIFAVMYFTGRLTEPLQDIVIKIKKAGEGDFSTKLETNEIWELEEISSAFNEATTKIEKLIKEVYEVQILARDIRIQYIQSQMNPHFMFNVLSMIGMRLKMDHNEELYKTVTAFSGLMRGKIFKENEVEVTLAEEMKLVEFYLYVQAQRFGDMINYHITWDAEKLKQCRIPRLCIEPFVENAVIHGLAPKGEAGDIYVSVFRKNDVQLVVTVEDNGAGFDIEEKSNGKETDHPGVGVKNIENLIHNLYGDEYGVYISSELDKGTKVEVVLPYLSGDKEDKEKLCGEY